MFKVIADLFAARQKKKEYTELFAGFIEFIRAQPSSVALEHTNWTACAVGDYKRARVLEDPANVVAAKLASVTGSDEGGWHPVGVKIKKTDEPTLMDFLGSSGDVLAGSVGFRMLKTYGDLQRLLIKLGYSSVTDQLSVRVK